MAAAQAKSCALGTVCDSGNQFAIEAANVRKHRHILSLSISFVCVCVFLMLKLYLAECRDPRRLFDYPVPPLRKRTGTCTESLTRRLKKLRLEFMERERARARVPASYISLDSRFRLLRDVFRASIAASCVTPSSRRRFFLHRGNRAEVRACPGVGTGGGRVGTGADERKKSAEGWSVP